MMMRRSYLTGLHYSQAWEHRSMQTLQALLDALQALVSAACITRLCKHYQLVCKHRSMQASQALVNAGTQPQTTGEASLLKGCKV